MTYACKLDAAVTALWCGTLLFDVKVPELTTWSLDHADLVGLGVVSGAFQLAIRRCKPSKVIVGRDGQFVRCIEIPEETYGCLRRYKSKSAFPHSSKSSSGVTYEGESVGRHLDGIGCVVGREVVELSLVGFSKR